MKKTLFALFLLSIVNCTSVNAQTTSPQTDTQKLQNLMDALAKPYITQNNIPGAAIAIYYKGHDYIYTYGVTNQANGTPVTADTIFELASITKIFTTTLLAVEIKTGKMQLEDPIIKYLPALSDTHSLPIDQVKVLNLATHTASFPREVTQFGVPKNDKNALMQALKNWHSPYPIGSKYLYSNISFGLLGVVIEGATGQQFSQVLSDNILHPLNMQNTMVVLSPEKQSIMAQGYNAKKQPSPYFVPSYLLGGGALRSSAADMLKFMKANLSEPNSNASPQLLSAMQFAQQAQFQVRPNFIMALGWQRILRNGALYITKNGGNQGFNTFIGFSPDKKFGVVVLTNKRNAKANKLGNHILNQMAVLD